MGRLVDELLREGPLDYGGPVYDDFHPLQGGQEVLGGVSQISQIRKGPVEPRGRVQLEGEIRGLSTRPRDTVGGGVLHERGWEIGFLQYELGADAWVGLYRINDLISVHGNPGLSYYLLDGDASQFVVDIDLQFLLEVSELIAPYAGPGVSIALASAGDTSASDVDLTVTGGALFLHTEQIQPFAEIRLRGLTEEPAFEIAAGALFRF